MVVSKTLNLLLSFLRGPKNIKWRLQQAMTAKYKNKHSKKICILQKLNSQFYDQLKDYLSRTVDLPKEKKLELTAWTVYFHRCDFYRAATFYSVLSKLNKKKILEVRNKNKLNGLFIIFVPLFLLDNFRYFIHPKKLENFRYSLFIFFFSTPKLFIIGHRYIGQLRVGNLQIFLPSISTRQN